MAALVRSGKVRDWGISNAPAWYVAKLATLAAARGLPGPIALPYFYSLANRDLEDEHVSLAAEFGMGILPWSPLAYGLLTGKYHRESVKAVAPRGAGLPRDAEANGAMRPDTDKCLDGANPFGGSLFTERNGQIVAELRRIAEATGQSSARLALAWVTGRAGISSTLIGVSRIEQLNDNVAALQVALSAKHRSAPDRISTPEPRMLYSLFTPKMRQHAVFGGSSVVPWDPS